MEEQRILDNTKHMLHTFNRWYRDNNDTLDFTPHNDDHCEACKLLLSFGEHYKNEAEKYNLEVRRFADRVKEIENWLVDSKTMQKIFNHNEHVWAAIQGSEAENYFWGPGKPKPPLTPRMRELPILPCSMHALEVPEPLPSKPPSPLLSPPPLPTLLHQRPSESGPSRRQCTPPPRLEDRMANDSQRAAPFHMPLGLPRSGLVWFGGRT